jgi:hypothetical protein
LVCYYADLFPICKSVYLFPSAHYSVSVGSN